MTAKPIKAAVFDIDGTLAPYGEPVGRNVSQSLCALEEFGIRICLASGKPYIYVEGLARGIGLKAAVCIGENGAVFFDEEAKYIEKPVERPAFLNELQSALQKEFPALYFQENLVNITAFSRDIDSLVRAWDYLRAGGYFDRDDIALYLHKDAIDIIPAGINKGTALKAMKKSRGWDTCELVAVGDGENDLHMIPEVGDFLAVGDTLKSVKNRFPGIGEALHYLERMIL